MKLALIPPPKNPEWMSETDYQLVLPSFLQHRNYKDMVSWCADRGDYVILDNGVAEGIPVESEQDLYRLASTIGASEIVIPDVYGDKEGTLEKLKGWKFSEDFKHMAVVAAQNIDEAWDLIQIYVDDPRIDCIGLPRLLLDTVDVGFRWHCAGWLRNHIERDGVEVHLLGTNPNFLAEMHGYSTMATAGIRGVDTSAPFVYAAKGAHWPNSLGVSIARDAKYDQMDLHSFTPKGWGSQANAVAEINVKYLKEKVYGTSSPSS
jgi:hypothetical protein